MPKNEEFKLTLASYFSPERPHVSASTCRDWLLDPHYCFRRHFSRELPAEPPTPSMTRGTLVDQLVTGQPVTVCRKVLKKDDPEAYEAQKDMSEGLLLDAKSYEQALLMAEAVRTHPDWRDGLEGARFQVPLECRSNLGLQICGLPDRLDADGLVVDLKTTQASKLASPTAWLWHLRDMGYHVQAAMYRKLVRSNGLPYRGFAHFVAAPVRAGLAQARMFLLPESLVDEGERLLDEALAGIARNDFAPRRLPRYELPNVLTHGTFEDDDLSGDEA